MDSRFPLSHEKKSMAKSPIFSSSDQTFEIIINSSLSLISHIQFFGRSYLHHFKNIPMSIIITLVRVAIIYLMLRILPQPPNSLYHSQVSIFNKITRVTFYILNQIRKILLRLLIFFRVNAELLKIIY